MESVMQRIERKYPQLINCYGRISQLAKFINSAGRCSRCSYDIKCWNMEQELKRNCYAKPKYRYGFGRKIINPKTNPDWGMIKDEI